ncbi:MAG: hypothetical protein KAT05_00275 [Spirochaetes bacterium]|nr:hypothetical protein [Spirochaetota bacterium]
MKKEIKPQYLFYKSQLKPLLLGAGMIVLFFIIFFIIAVKTLRLDFYSFFFHSISKHIFLTIISSFHVGMLGIGILIIIIAFFNITPKIICYKDRFEIMMFLQKKKIINYNEINNISVRFFNLNYEDFFKRYPKKECRVFFNNPIHGFYLYYPVKGYFDNIEIFLKREKEDMSRRCLANRDSINELLHELALSYSIKIPYLPEQACESLK